MTTVWVYVDTSQQVGDPDHLKVFAKLRRRRCMVCEGRSGGHRFRA